MSSEASILSNMQRDEPDRLVDELNVRFAGSEPSDILELVIGSDVLGRMALISSFGTESAVLLHIAASIRPEVPVLFINTGKHFSETLAYREMLVERLGLTNVTDIHPDPELLAARDIKGTRWSYDPDMCCHIRKVESLKRALEGFAGSITGRKAFQAKTRARLMPFENDGDRLKVNPLANWTKSDLESHYAEHDLPRHPLESEGFLSVGCAPCTSKVLPGEDIRAGRWRNFGKTECGIHLPRKTREDSGDG